MRLWKIHALNLTLRASTAAGLVVVGTGAAAISGSPVQAASVVKPSAPQIIGAATASHRATVRWSPPTSPGSSPVTGYRVSRDGTDLEGKGSWSTVVTADQRSFTMTLLRDGATYTLTVQAVSSAGESPVAKVGVTPTSTSKVPGAPVAGRTAVGKGTMTLAWTPPETTGSSPVTGYRVSRDGVDTHGTGPWSTVVPAAQRSFTMSLLRPGVSYGFSVAAVSAAGTGPAWTVRLTPAGGNPTPAPTPAPVSSDKPVVVQSAVGQPATLRQGGANGPRLRMAGVTVWGVPDQVTSGGDFALDQYADRDEIVATAKAWGANHIRLRVLADDYDNDRQGLSKAQRLAMIVGWRNAARAQGLYLYVTWWTPWTGTRRTATGRPGTAPPSR